MELRYSSRFKRRFKKLNAGVRRQALERLHLFVRNPFHPLLHNHMLRGERFGERSINISGDYRIIYQYVEPNVVFLIAIGTHSELYGS